MDVVARMNTAYPAVCLQFTSPRIGCKKHILAYSNLIQDTGQTNLATAKLLAERHLAAQNMRMHTLEREDSASQKIEDRERLSQ